MDFQEAIYFQPGREEGNDAGKNESFDLGNQRLKCMYKSKTYPAIFPNTRERKQSLIAVVNSKNISLLPSSMKAIEET